MAYTVPDRPKSRICKIARRYCTKARSRFLSTGAILIWLTSLVFVVSSCFTYAFSQELRPFGYKIKDRSRDVPLLVVLVRYKEFGFDLRHSPDYYEKLIFGDGISKRTPNIAGVGGFFEQNSNGNFRFTNAGIIGPIMSPDDPSTPVDESMYACIRMKAQGCDWGTGSQYRNFASVIQEVARQGFDFSKYGNPVTNKELVVLLIESNPLGLDSITTSDTDYIKSGGVLENSGYEEQGLQGHIIKPNADPLPPGVVPLHAWWSALRRDHFMTTNSRWNGHRAPDYKPRNPVVAGYIYSPDLPKPVNRNGHEFVAIYSWWSEQRQDHFLTSRLDWAGNTGDRRDPDYTFVRKEGFVLKRKPPSSSNGVITPADKPLKAIRNWWSPSLQKNFASTREDWSNQTATVPPDYEFVRIEGYAYPSQTADVHKMVPLYEWKSDTRNDTYLTTDPNWQVSHVDYSYLHNEGYVFSPNLPQPPGTLELFSWYSTIRGDNLLSTEPFWRGVANKLIAPDYQFVRSEGYVYEPENLQPNTRKLTRWTIGRQADGGGVTRATDPARVKVPSRSTGTVEVSAFMPAFGESANPSLMIHELTHALGVDWESYSANSPVLNGNFGYTTMNGTIGGMDDFHSAHLDPFAKMSLGWSKPNIISAQSTQTIEITASAIPDRGDHKLYLLPHPRLGAKEFYLFEHRNKVDVRDSVRTNQTMPLYGWWSPARSDNFATTNPIWQGRTGETRQPDYNFDDVLGHVVAPSQIGIPSRRHVALYHWYSPTRQDNILTTDREWAEHSGQVKAPDYRFVALEGYVFSPAYPQPENTTPLYSWWSPSQKDHFITTRTDWAGSEGDVKEPDYKFVRHEGYIHPNESVADTAQVPLTSWWSEKRTDNRLTTQPDWADNPDGTINTPDYRFVREEGVIFSPYNPKPPGTTELSSWYSPSRNDHFETALPQWQGNPGDTRPPDYQYVRRIGYVYPVGDEQPADTVPLNLWWNPVRKDNYLTSDLRWAAGTHPPPVPGYEHVRTEGYANLGVEVNYDGDPWQTGDLAFTDQGLAIWHVETDGAGHIALRSGSPSNVLKTARMLDGSTGILTQNLRNSGSPVANLRWYDGSAATRVSVITDVNKPTIKVVVRQP